MHKTEQAWFFRQQDIMDAAFATAQKIQHDMFEKYGDPINCVNVYAVPRGGIPAMYALGVQGLWLQPVDDPDKADIIVDDLVDSGTTKRHMLKHYPDKPFFALFEKKPEEPWYVFPWETAGLDHDKSAIDIPVRLLQFIGEDVKRGGLEETPRRFLAAWKGWTIGYKQDPASVLKSFHDGANGVDELVIVKDLPFYSQCEHHLAPFFGTASIGYIPNGKIVGLSKLSRLLDIYARRLQVQERLTNQVAEALQTHLGPIGVGVVIRARHLCMESRGICKQGHETITSAMRGALCDNAKARAEFLELLK